MKKTLVACLALVLGSEAAFADAPPRLIVQITIDQLRGDLPLRYRDRFGDGGFRYFLDRGTWYSDAHHPHSHTETIVGHTTLATGAYPSRHGMVANAWFDRATNKFIDNIEGPQYPLLSVNGEPQTEAGASPVSILTTTFSDELAITTNRKAKIFSVSIKDRGAIPLAGHSGKAFWFSKANGCFVSSTFYYSAYPDWVKTWCQQNPANRYANKTWALLNDRSTYLYSDVTNQYPAGSVAEANMATMDHVHFNRTFPHTFPPAPYLYDPLTTSPYGDELTLDFVLTLLKSESLGKDSVPDYLAVSFSATDLISHWFSPASLESEDNILRLDGTLAKLLAFIDTEVGLRNTLIVLSGDHGGIEYPEYLATLGIANDTTVTTNRLTPKQIMDAAQQALTARYGAIEGIVSAYSHPYFYLNQSVLTQNNLNKAEVESVVAKGLMTLIGIRAALTTSEMQSGSSSVDPQMSAQVRRNYNPARSGDVYVVQQPQWQAQEKNDEGTNLLQHNSGWAYDTYVPIAFAGKGVPASMISRSVSTVDVAATLAVLLRTKYPSGCVGEPLKEVVPSTPATDPPTKPAVTAKPSR